MAGKNKKKKGGALAAAARKKLENIGPKPMTEYDVAHAMWHLEEQGRAVRVPLDDGSWAWAVRGQNGEQQVLKPTPEMLRVLEHFEAGGHEAH
jgi:hypothetical protein